MLTAPHENASSWNLYTGDRAIVDWMLDKTMLATDPMPASWLARYFHATHYLHLLAMTYVAGQKSWDGVYLLCLLVVMEGVKWLFTTDDVVRNSLEREGISCDAVVVKPSGRTPMLGGIQLLHDRVLNPKLPERTTSWMHGIIVETQRFKVWSDLLLKVANDEGTEDNAVNLIGLSDNDVHWVKKNIALTKDAVDSIEKALLKLEKPTLTV